MSILQNVYNDSMSSPCWTEYPLLNIFPILKSLPAGCSEFSFRSCFVLNYYYSNIVVSRVYAFADDIKPVDSPGLELQADMDFVAVLYSYMVPPRAMRYMSGHAFIRCLFIDICSYFLDYSSTSFRRFNTNKRSLRIKTRV